MTATAGSNSAPGGAGSLHVLTPAHRCSIPSLVQTGDLKAGDLIADLRRFPPTAHQVVDGTVVDITAQALPSRDYWAVARRWLAGVTVATGLQDALEIDGHGIWWTLNGQRFVPALSELGSTFSWIDLLAALCDAQKPQPIVVHGRHGIILHILAQVCPGAKVEVRGTTQSRQPGRNVSLGRAVLLAARLVMGATYLLYSLVRRPEVVFFSATTLMRAAGHGGPLRDVYLADVAEALRTRGWCTVFVEKYGPNATWAGFRARGVYFPNDLLFLLSDPVLQRRGPGRSIFGKWSARWEAIQAQVAPHLSYQGCDLAPILLPLIAREFQQHAPNLEIMTGAWSRILRIWRPRLLYVSNSYGRSAVPAIIAAKALGIPTLEQQHGVMNRDHIPYLVPRAPSIKTAFPLCDRFAVWGKHFKRLLVDANVYPPEQVTVTGFPRIDALLDDLPARQQTLATLDLPPDAEVVLYTSNEIAASFMPDILDGIAASANPNLYWIIKLHPREPAREAWEAGVAQRGLDRVRIVQREIDFYALLAACDVHISFTSTTLVEAAILGKLNLGLDIAGVPDPVGYADAGAFLPVIPSQIGPVVEKVLGDPTLRQRLANEQQAFAQDWCVHDGNAVERLVTLAESIITLEGTDAKA